MDWFTAPTLEHWPETESPTSRPSSTSLSWSPALDVSSFGGAEGERLPFNHTSDDATHESTWSPAAAFLSSFNPSTPPLSDTSPQTIAGYVLGRVVGCGGFSTIRQATDPSGGIVAVKIVRHSAFNKLPAGEKARQQSRLSHEARVWVSLSHENILPLFDFHRTSEAIYLITLFCPAGSLFDILKREGTPALEQTDAGCMFRQVVKALAYLHNTMGLVHGDVKLENVLVDESGVCRLTDFGFTRRIGEDSSQISSASEEDYEDEPPSKRKQDPIRSRRSCTTGLPVHLSLMRHGPQRHRKSSPLPATVAPPTHPDHIFQPGSLPYASPELLLPYSCYTDTVQAPRSRPTAHPAQDMWALGVLLFALLTGTLPFRDSFEPRLQMKILRGTYEIPPAIGPLAESVLKGCLERAVSKRWTISMVDDASWGIGYGNIDLDPSIQAVRHTQSPTRPRTPPSDRLSPCGDLPVSMSALSLPSAAAVDIIPIYRARPQRITVRSRSRSPSPSVAPRTPNDDDDEDDLVFFGRGHNGHRPQRDSGDVQIVLEDEDLKWDSRDTAYDDDHVGTEADGARFPLKEGLERLDGVRGRQENTGSILEEARKSQTRTLSWS